jgi:hypothetical protein
MLDCMGTVEATVRKFNEPMIHLQYHGAFCRLNQIHTSDTDLQSTTSMDSDTFQLLREIERFQSGPPTMSIGRVETVSSDPGDSMNDAVPYDRESSATSALGQVSLDHTMTISPLFDERVFILD